MDFTLKKYQQLLSAIIDNQIKVYTIYGWLENNPENGICIRHDIDRKPQNALKMAILENKYNIFTTYYFRITKNSFNKGIILKIKNLGHEIGYHYEDLSLVNGNIERAKNLFSQHLEMFRELDNISSIAMHGRPFSKFNNIDILNYINLKEFNIKGDASGSIDYSNTFYFTDTGRSWSKKSVNLRDTVESKFCTDIKSTNALIEFINKNKNHKISITAHSERWSPNPVDWIYQYCLDMTINLLKRLIKFSRQ
jgi:hypothetical protein